VKHFKLDRHFRLNTEVTRVTRDKEKQKWTISYKLPGNQQIEESFDKLVVANGTNNLPKIPALTGQDDFKGEILHSMNFKRYNYICQSFE
jgi:cation diffusion facilitator CzcD-associated flavoprotein CzcO